MAVNPVIPGFYPDPSVCRVGEDYYLACSSFEYFPGVPIFHSRDLVNWTPLGNVLDRASQLPLRDAKASDGIYAPTLRHHDGTFWLTVTNTTTAEHFIVTAADPAGPWSEPTVVPGLPGIDPDLAWDHDGTCYFTYSHSRDGDAQIEQVRLNPATGEVLDSPRVMWSGTGLVHPEAPHLYRIGSWWYLLIAEGGTGHGHAVSIARGNSPAGPFEGHPNNPVLSHRSLGSPIRNSGHADLIEGPDGRWWMVMLGVRLRGGFPGVHVLGRETFLTPVDWVDEWPIPRRLTLELGDDAGVTIEGGATDERWESRDDFDAPSLGPEWISVRDRPTGMVSLTDRPGWLTLTATGESLDGPVPAVVGRRQQHLDCTVRARIDVSAGRGGLVVRLDDTHHYEIEAGDRQVRVLARIGPLTTVVATHSLDEDLVTLEVRADTASTEPVVLAPPDHIRLGLEVDGQFHELASLDGRYLSTEVAGGFTGRVIGMYADQGTVSFDWYDYRARS